MSLEYTPYGIAIVGSGKKGHADPKQYEAHVKSVLDMIARSNTGKALLKAIPGTGRRIEIVPFPLLGTQYATMTGSRSPRWQKAIGWISFDPTDTGSSLSAFCTEVFCLQNQPAGGSTRTPASTLVHELVHAYRHVRGNFSKVPLSGRLSAYHDEEEFFAILIQNIYLADPTSPVSQRILRADHQGYAPLPSSARTSMTSLAEAEYRRLVGKFYAQEPLLGSGLSSVPGAFNPFREYVNQWRAVDRAFQALLR